MRDLAKNCPKKKNQEAETEKGARFLDEEEKTSTTPKNAEVQCRELAYGDWQCNNSDYDIVVDFRFSAKQLAVIVVSNDRQFRRIVYIKLKNISAWDLTGTELIVDFESYE